jgi:CheY-like chemotaxis protein
VESCTIAKSLLVYKTNHARLSQKYKSASQKWSFLFANRGKVILNNGLLIASSHEGRMDQIANERIMIVGRDSHLAYLLQRFVRTGARQVVAANPSDDVLSLARCEKPVAIVLEVDTPQTVGWQTLRTLKSDPETNGIPVIICSWLDESARGLAAGADVYLRMPILYEDFGAAVTAVLSKEQNDQNL